jgi:hypothetical protein
MSLFFCAFLIQVQVVNPAKEAEESRYWVRSSTQTATFIDASRHRALRLLVERLKHPEVYAAQANTSAVSTQAFLNRVLY